VKLGIENKKQTAVLGVLILVAGFAVYWNFFSGPSQPAARPPAVAAASAVADVLPVVAAPAASEAPRRPRAGSGSEEFRPVLRSKRPEDRIDPMTVDPTLHLDVLARLQNAGAEGNGRNVFQFGPPPAPPAVASASRLKMPEPVVMPQSPIAGNMAPITPPPPPIPLKFYGMVTVHATGKKSAFFRQSENILIAGEGEILLNRYRVGRIGVNSVVIEDTQLKREQTLPLAEDGDGP